VNQIFKKSFKPFSAVLVIIMALFLNACGGSVGSDSTGVSLVTIEISANEPQSLPKLTQSNLIAVGVYNNDSFTNLTKGVIWESSDESVVTISNGLDNEGVIFGVEEGTAVITASVPVSGVVSSIDVTVLQAPLISLSITPDAHELARGQTLQYKATGTLLDESERDYTERVNWISADQSLVTIDNTEGSKGLATAVVLPVSSRPGGSGVATIAASYEDSFSGLVQDVNTLGVRPAELDILSIEPGNLVMHPQIVSEQQFMAIGIQTNGAIFDFTDSVSWESSDPGVASVSNDPGNEGYVSGLTAGAVTISASGIVNDGSSVPVTASAQLVVTTAAIDKLEITPSGDHELALSDSGIGPTLPLTATATFADDDGNGAALIRDLTEWVTWASLDNNILSVENNVPGSRGVVRGIGIGSAAVTAELLGTIGTSGVINVTPSPLQDITISPGGTSTRQMTLGIPVQFRATGYYENGTTPEITTEVLWESSDDSVATVSNDPPTQGLVTPVSQNTGSINITATVIDAVSGETIVGTATAVVNAASLVSVFLQQEPAHDQDTGFAKNTQRRFKMKGNYTDGTVRDITYSNSASFRIASDQAKIIISGEKIMCPGPDGTLTAVTTRQNRGLVTAGGIAETARIWGVYEIGRNKVKTTPAISLQISDADLLSIAIEPLNNTPMVVGEVRQFKAVGTFSDSSSQDISRQVVWTSDADVVTVETGDRYSVCNDKPSPVPGRVTAVAAGQANVIVTDPVTGINQVIEIQQSKSVTVQ